MATKKHANFTKPTKPTKPTEAPDRTSSIRGAIAPRPKAETTVAEQQTTQPAVAAPRAEELSVETPPVDEQSTSVTDSNEVTKAVVFWVRTEVKTWVTANAKERRLNNADMIQRAIEGAYDTLSAQAPAQAPKGRQLFAKAPKSAPRRRDGAVRGQLFARFTQTNLKVIDSLVDELGLGNRSVLVEDAVLTMINSKEN